MLKLDLSSCKNFNICEAPFFPLHDYLIKRNPSVLDTVALSFGSNFTRLPNKKTPFSLLKILCEDYDFQKTHQKELK